MELKGFLKVKLKYVEEVQKRIAEKAVGWC